MWISKKKWKELNKRIEILEEKAENKDKAYCFEVNKYVTFEDYVRLVPKMIKKAIAKSNSQSL